MSEKQPEKKDTPAKNAEAAAKEKEMEAKRRTLDETGGGEPKNATGS
jgi:hypothetical protein